MDALLQDLRYALRQLLRNPGFAMVAVATLAVGIGANTAIFSVVDGVVLRPLPYPDQDRLVGFVEAGNYKGMLLEYRDRTESFDEIAGYTQFPFEVSLTGDGEPVRLQSAAVTAGLFATLGAPPLLGRTFVPEEEWAGRHHVVVLSHALWRQRYGADPGVVGRAIQLDGRQHQVVGVMPSGFAFPSQDVQLWVPFGIDRSDPLDLWSRTAGSFIGRLRPGVTVEQAGAEIGTVAPQLRELFPWQMPQDFWADATVVPLQDQLVGDARPTLFVLLGAVGLVLLIACANVANLLLARAATRRKEMAIRAAVGAGSGRIARQVLTESLLLASVAGGAGLLLAFWGVELLRAGLPPDTPRLQEIAINGRVLGVTLLLTLGTGLLFGTLPALHTSRVRAFGALKEGGRAGRSALQRRLSGLLVAGEVALAVMLVIGATLLIRSFWELRQVDLGFRAEELVTATVAPPGFRYPDPAARRAFHQDLLERLAAIPGVRGVAATDRLPFGTQGWGSVFIIEGRPDPATEGGDWPWADIAGAVSEGYFAEMGIPILEGRPFGPTDREDAPRVAIVNQGLAREYWPDESPVGRRVRGPGDDWITIVGIAADTRVRAVAGETDTALYRPLAQSDPAVLSIVLRTSLAPAAMVATLREAVHRLDRDTPVEDIRSMGQLVSGSVADERFTMLLLTAFAGAALLLGALGIYGVLAYAVNERRRELGLRMALGAHRGDILLLVLRQGAFLAGGGLALGLLGAAVGSRVLSGLVYGVSTTDPATFLVVPAVLLGVAGLACLLPARRAVRVEPMAALRVE
jgi:putative ABC transport system permease protein